MPVNKITIIPVYCNLLNGNNATKTLDCAYCIVTNRTHTNELDNLLSYYGNITEKTIVTLEEYNVGTLKNTTTLTEGVRTLFSRKKIQHCCNGIGQSTSL